MIQRALAPHLITHENKHGIIAISHVEVYPDLSEAKIYVDAELRVTKLVQALNRKAGVLKKEISPYLTMKRTPKLRFVIDEQIRAARKIEELLEG